MIEVDKKHIFYFYYSHTEFTKLNNLGGVRLSLTQ